MNLPSCRIARPPILWHRIRMLDKSCWYCKLLEFYLRSTFVVRNAVVFVSAVRPLSKSLFIATRTRLPCTVSLQLVRYQHAFCSRLSGGRQRKYGCIYTVKLYNHERSTATHDAISPENYRNRSSSLRLLRSNVIYCNRTIGRNMSHSSDMALTFLDLGSEPCVT